MQRWQAHGFLGSAERQQLLQALQQLPPAGRHVLKAKAEALQTLCSEWLAPGGAASRLLVCAQSETLLDGLEQALRLRKLPVQRLRAGMDAAERATRLTSWRSEAQALLLASDSALDDLDDELDEPRLGLVHADLPWDAQQLQARLTLAAGSAARGVPAALLLVEGTTDRALLAVQHQTGATMPAWLAAPPAWLADEELEALMAALAALLAALAA
jgi:superfamily II DNA/RNA helicase